MQLAYAIGVADPVSVMVDTYGTGKIADTKMTELVREHFKLTPKGIIDDLDLRQADLQEDGGLRALRPHRRRLHLGENRPRRRASQGGGL